MSGDWKSRAKPVEAPVADWRSRAKPLADVGSPLDQALANQTGDVVTVETPTGPAQFTRGGDRFYGKEEAKQQLDSQEPAFRQKLLEGALSTLSGGGPLVDEMAGAAKAFSLPALAQKTVAAARGEDVEAPLDTYRNTRDRTRLEVARATQHASPSVALGGVSVPVLPAIGSMLPSALVPLPASALGRVALGGVLGAEQEAGTSSADLTRGEGAQFAKDVGAQAALGAGASGLAEGVTAVGKKFSGGLLDRLKQIRAARAAKDASDVAEEVASLRGKLGGESQKASRLFENTQRATSGGVPPAGQSPIDPALQQRAMLALSDPSTRRLQEKVLERSLNEMPGQTSVVEALEQELAQKVAGAPGEASLRTRDYFRAPVYPTEVAPRLKTLGENALLGAAAGAATGGASMAIGVPGSASIMNGMIAGIGTSALSGGSGLKTVGKNFLASPRVRAGALQEALALTREAPKALQRGAQSMTQAGVQSRDQESEDAISAFLTGG